DRAAGGRPRGDRTHPAVPRAARIPRPAAPDQPDARRGAAAVAPGRSATRGRRTPPRSARRSERRQAGDDSMRPLREMTGEPGTLDAETAREARLLRSVSPLQPSLARMRRVRLRVEAQPVRWWQSVGARPLLAASALAVALVAVVQHRLHSAAVV